MQGGRKIVNTPIPLKQILDDTGRSYGWLADESGISRQRMYHYLSGRTPCPDKLKLKIAKIMKMSVQKLFFDHLEA